MRATWRSRSWRTWGQLTRLARFLAGTLDWGIVLERSDAKVLTVTTDSNWAGCKRTRKSTTCFCVQLGGGTLVMGSRTQTALAMSSAEAEYYGAVTGAAEGLYLRDLFGFLGWELSVRVVGDADAARAVASRRGIGRCRTLDLRTLWLQEKVAAGLIQMGRVAGAVNVADLGTKVLAGPRLRMLAGRAGLRRCSRDGAPTSL